MPNGALLVRLVDASFEGGDALAAVRDECVSKLGAETTVNAAAVIANFHMMTRIADGTGTPLDEGTKNVSAEVRADLDLDTLDTKRFDPTVAPA